MSRKYKYTYTLFGRRVRTAERYLTGAVLRQGMDPVDQLWEACTGPGPDLLVALDATYDLADTSPSFYAVPPATTGHVCQDHPCLCFRSPMDWQLQPQETAVPEITEIKPVRCKFRCLNVKLGHDGHHIARLAPIYAKDGAPENLWFFKWTPTGEADVGFGVRANWKSPSEKGLVPYPGTFEQGKAYYIDIGPAVEGDEDPWTFQNASPVGTQLDVEFARVNGSGKLAFTTNNPAAMWALLEPYLAHFRMNVVSEGRLGQLKVSLRFTPAE